MLGFYQKVTKMCLRLDHSVFVSVDLTYCPPVLKGLCRDLHYCVGFCAGERYLRLWDIASRINDQRLTYNVHKPRSDGTQEIVPMCESQRWAEVQTLVLVP